jgi:cob(I)alamin adenosyltransferase
MIHVYTGCGKGKTTAALGLTLRALGAGKRVHIIQFLKQGICGELKALKKFSDVTCERFGGKCFVKRARKKDKILARTAFKRAQEIIDKRACDILILDEINVALKLHLLNAAEVVKLIKRIPKSLEVVLTGRDAPKQIIAIADYATEMKEIRHPYQYHAKARRGIEF